MRNKKLWWLWAALGIIALTTGCFGSPSQEELARQANMEAALKTMPLPATILTETNVLLLVESNASRSEFLVEYFDTESTRRWVPRDYLIQQAAALAPNTDAPGVREILYRYWEYRTQLMNPK